MNDNKHGRSLSRRQFNTTLAAGLAAIAAPLPSFAQNKSVIAATGIDAYFTMFPVARDQKIFEKQGLSFTYRAFEDSTVGLDAVLTNNADMGAATPSSGIARWDRGGKLYVAGRMNSSGTLYAVAVNDKINEPEDLHGKTVAFPRLSSGEYFFNKYVAYHELDRSKISSKSISGPETVAAMERGDIDAIFLWEPWPGKAVQIVKGAKIIALSQDIDLRFSVYFYFSQALLEDQARGEAVMRALVEGADFCENNKGIAAVAAQKAFRLPPEDAKKAVDSLHFRVEMNRDELIKDFTDQAQFALDAGVIKKIPNWDDFIQPQFLKAVAPDRVTGW
jgi:NitT/TauT family transport system substrate-binding protein